MFKKSLIRGLTVLILVASAAAAWAFSNEIAQSNLPKKAQNTLSLIQQGGPFPFEKDGIVFGNYERLLPQQKRGYYQEYTVKMAAAKTRGAVRIVCGGNNHKALNDCYYTEDHYSTFKKITP